MIIWFTGLSGAGKSTLSDALKEKLEELNFSVFQVDGDLFRKETKKENDFSRDAIIENNQKIIAFCKQIENDYDFIIVSVISPYKETRNKAREIFGAKYTEIFLDCPLEELIKKDVKGIYKKAMSGEIKNLIGFSENSPYERPENPDIKINTNKTDIEGSLGIILKFVKKTS